MGLFSPHFIFLWGGIEGSLFFLSVWGDSSGSWEKAEDGSWSKSDGGTWKKDDDGSWEKDDDSSE